jgi:hypothetical protein
MCGRKLLKETKMSVFKKKPEMVRVSFQCPVELGARLKKLEDSAKIKGLVFSLDDHLAASLGRLLSSAEKELTRGDSA